MLFVCCELLQPVKEHTSTRDTANQHLFIEISPKLEGEYQVLVS